MMDDKRTSDLLRAVHFATEAHGDQKRRDGRPYVLHPLKMAQEAQVFGCPSAVVIACVLHDVVEDTDATLELVESLFGEVVAKTVSQVTKLSYPGMNRRQRHEAELERMLSFTPEAKIVKLLDILDNADSIVDVDPDFARVYVPEKAEQVIALLSTPAEFTLIEILGGRARRLVSAEIGRLAELGRAS